MLSDETKTAYEALIENGPRNICATTAGVDSSPAAKAAATAEALPPLLPALPPKSDSVRMSADNLKRHVRKNPLVIHDQAAPPKRDTAGFRLKKTPGLTVQVPGHGHQQEPGFRRKMLPPSGGGGGGHYETFDDEIAKSMNALDDIR